MIIARNLPSNWAIVKLGDICSKSQYGWTSKAINHGSTKFLRTTDISSNKVDWNSVPYCQEIPEDINKYQLSKNDILISRSGSVGISYRINAEINFPAIFASYLIRFRSFENTTSEYLEYFFQSKEYWSQVSEFASGIAIPNINASKLEQIEIPYPPLEEQQLIVERIKLLKNKSEKIKQKLERNQNHLNQWRKSALNSISNGELTKKWRSENITPLPLREMITAKEEQYKLDYHLRALESIPTSWNWEALGNYAKLSRGRFSIRPRNDPRFFDGQYPFIQIGDLPKEGGLIQSHKQTLNEEGKKVSKLFKKDTIVIAIVGSTIGNTGILGYDMYFTDSMVGINTGNSDSNYYLEYYLRAEKDRIRAASYSGGGQPNIKLQILNNYPVPVPPLEEQKIIVKKIEEIFLTVESLREKYEKIKLYVKNIDNTTLLKAFSGKLISNVENSESVSELLKRFTLMKNQPIEKERKTKTAKSSDSKEADIILTIKKAFPDRFFSFDELRSNSSLSYEILSQQLIQLISLEGSSAENILMVFDSKKNSILFKLN